MVTAVATAVSLNAVTSGALNSLGWSTVAIYAFFTAAWANIALRRTALTR